MTRATWLAAGLAAAALAACGKREPAEAPPPQPELAALDALALALPPPPPPADAAAPWPELDGLPRAEPVRVIALPIRPDVPRFSVGGPIVVGDLAVVASSQLGFAAVDWRRGALAWTKPAGLHVAPPLVVSDGIALIGDCASPPSGLDADARLIGCLRVVTFGGVDLVQLPITARPAAVEEFAAASGTQQLWRQGERAVRWRRGERAVLVDLVTGRATPAEPSPPPLAIAHKERKWEVALEDGVVVARWRRNGPVAWRSAHAYTALLGSVWLPDGSPILRLVELGDALRLVDLDAAGAPRPAAPAARAAPGVAMLGAAVSTVGAAAIAMRLDRTARRDYLAGFAASGALVWVYPLPERPRPDPVGVAVAPGAVVVFHDGDSFTVLPGLTP